MESGDAFSRIARTLDIQDSSVSQAARRLMQGWQYHRSAGSFNTDPTSFALCALFVANTMQRSSEDGSDTSGTMSLTLSDLLGAADVHIKRFFDWMGRLQADVTLDPVVKPRLKAIMQKYCVTIALYDKFQQLFNRIFIREHYSPPLESGVDQGQPNRKHICWMLFLLAKGSLRQAANELVMPLHLLMGCIDYIAKLSPAFFLQEPFNSAHYSQDTEDAILEALCAEVGCVGDIADVMSVRESCFTPIISAIPRERLNQGLEGLPELKYLQQQYERVYRAAGDIDEQLFLDQSSHLFVRKIAANEPPTCSSPDSSHERDHSAVPMTPVKKAINSVQSLKSLLSEAIDSPSSLLLKYFKSCSLDPSSSIQQRVNDEKQEYILHFKRIMGSPSGSVARSRFQIGVRLYYRVMASMLKREEERLSTKDFSSLLHSDLFHKSLLACALEVVNVTYEYSPSEVSTMPGTASRLLFPWILDVFSLKAFDFSKVLESFMKDEPKLTQEAKKHLQSIETRIVESMAWQSSSPLHDLIQTAGNTLQLTSPVTTSSRTNGLSLPNTTAADMYLSPLRPNPRPLASSEATPPSSALTSSSPFPQNPSHGDSNPSPQPSNIPMSPRRMRSVSLNMFLNKVLQLAYGRLERLCSMLNVSKDLEKYMWTCVEYCVTNKADLLKNRHLDQIIMSCIYSICKVTDSELKFKDIVNAYRTLPHAEATTYRNVDIDGTKENTIIIFYNEVFMPVMKIYILRFQPKNPTPTLSPAPTRSSTLSQSSPSYRAAPNLFISPMKESPFKSPQPVREGTFRSPSQNTPMKRTRYSFGEGPGSSEKLREINERMREASVDSPKNNRSSTSKRLKFEDDDVQTSATSQTDRSVANGNGVSSSNGHLIPKSLSDDPMGTRALPPSMQHRVAMMTSDRNVSLGVVESKK